MIWQSLVRKGAGASCGGNMSQRLDRVRKQMTVSGIMSREMDRGESRNNWRQVKNESDEYLDHNSKSESGNAKT